MKQCCFLILVAAMCIATASAQEEDVLRPQGRDDNDGATRTEPRQSTRFIIGPELGINLNMFSSNITGAPDKSPLYVFESGTGVSVFAGIYFEVGLNRNFGIGARLLYDMKSFGNTMDSALVDCPDVLGEIIQGGFAGAVVPIQSKYTSSYTYFTINPLLRWSPSEEVIIHIGPVIQLAASDTIRTTFTLTIAESELCRFNPGQANESTTSSATVDAESLIKTRFGIDVGVGYRIALAPSIALVPRIGYQYMFSNFDEDDLDLVDDSRSQSIGSTAYTHTDFKLTSLQASVALWFTL